MERKQEVHVFAGFTFLTVGLLTERKLDCHLCRSVWRGHYQVAGVVVFVVYAGQSQYRVLAHLLQVVFIRFWRGCEVVEQTTAASTRLLHHVPLAKKLKINSRCVKRLWQKEKLIYFGRFHNDYGFVSTEGNIAEEIAKVIQTNYYWRKISWIL